MYTKEHTVPEILQHKELAQKNETYGKLISEPKQSTNTRTKKCGGVETGGFKIPLRHKDTLEKVNPGIHICQGKLAVRHRKAGAKNRVNDEACTHRHRVT